MLCISGLTCQGLKPAISQRVNMASRPQTFGRISFCCEIQTYWQRLGCILKHYWNTLVHLKNYLHFPTVAGPAGNI